ncbi:hypothetical protein [Nocardia sp. NPDC051570]|uniref:hypothetical protein n=1 Tax=Nocardia sp. NPDC051570 TaxID=3364324 RepID=UPI0037A06C76
MSRSEGTACPHTVHTPTTGRPAGGAPAATTAPETIGSFTRTSTFLHRDADSTARAEHHRTYRRRIRFADADLVRDRVLGSAEDVIPAGARRNVLAATLALLCGWARLSDDRIRIRQLIGLCGPRRYDPKTIGRALAALHRDEFIRYIPARGRGAYATIAIHPRFLDGITELQRDPGGRVITFSHPPPYSSKRNHLPTLRPRSGAARPASVTVDAEEVREVLANAPEPFRSLRARLRWCLGREIRTYLTRGWRPDQLLATLAATLPDQVRRPLLLARYRFQRNLIGAGPRLAPAQRAWDRRHRADGRARHDEQQRRHAAAVFAATTATMRARMLTALCARLRLTAPLPDPTTAVIHAARLALRAFPDTSLGQAIDRWVAQFEPSPSDVSDSPTPTAEERDECVVCGAKGQPREELPLRSVVCERCWRQEGM